MKYFCRLNEVTVRILMINYIIKFEDSLKVAELFSSRPVWNIKESTPDNAINGKIPKVTRAVRHSK